MTSTSVRDGLGDHERVYLEKQRLAAGIILELAEDGQIPDTLETELYIFRDRVDRALLLLGATSEILPWHEAPAPRAVPRPEDGSPGRVPQ